MLIARAYQAGLGQAWFTRFRLETDHAENLLPEGTELTVPTSTCNAFAGQTGCTSSCPTTSTFKVGCTLPDGTSSTCNGTKYTFNSATFGLTMDFAGVTGSSTTAAGTMGVAFQIAANVNGGKLDDKKLECAFGLSFDIAKLKAGTQAAPTPSCDNFSCKYDEHDISCDDMKTKIASNSNNSCS